MIRDQGKDVACCRNAKASSDLSRCKTKTKSALKSNIHEGFRLATVLTGEYGRKDGQDRVGGLGGNIKGRGHFALSQLIGHCTII